MLPDLNGRRVDVRDVILIVGTALAFLFSWYLVVRLGRFLDENQKRIREDTEQQPEPYVRMDGDISIDELKETLSRFHSSHAHAKIVIYDSEQISFPNHESDCAQ